MSYENLTQDVKAPIDLKVRSITTSKGTTDSLFYQAYLKVTENSPAAAYFNVGSTGNNFQVNISGPQPDVATAIVEANGVFTISNPGVYRVLYKLNLNHAGLSNNGTLAFRLKNQSGSTTYTSFLNSFATITQPAPYTYSLELLLQVGNTPVNFLCEVENASGVVQNILGGLTNGMNTFVEIYKISN